MKNCQGFRKNKTNKVDKYKLILAIFLICFLCICFKNIGTTGAQSFGAEEIIKGWGGGKPKIEVKDEDVKKQVEKEGEADEIKWYNKWISEEAIATGYKKMLSYFLNELAYETATKLATGDWGQKPLIEHRTFKDVFKETADNAAGYFIEELGKQGFGGVKFNLCQPDFAIKYKITLGLQKYHKPPKPECTFSQMKENWEEELRDPDFLPKFQDSFNPWENDLGIALSLQTGLGSEVDKKANEAGLEKLANQGFKPITDKITGFIKSPARIMDKWVENTIEKSGEGYLTYTGSAAADAIGVFMNTLVGTLMDEWLNPEKGIVTSFPEPKIWDYESQSESEGIAGANERFKKLLEPSFGVRGDYNILAELTSCSDPTKAGPTNCVIEDKFRQAVINKMTVGKAMEQGYLDSSWAFGFTADGLEPSYIEGYPYRSMKILRKFRIIPVGWEIAAQYINDFLGETKNLGDLVACYDLNDNYEGYYASWCDGLVDPNWVLKAPLNYCKREGPGPEIISEMVTGSGYDSELSVSRNSNYCADEQSCIKENNDGSCQLYGYCTEEKRRWQFNAESCEPKYNTCQTFKREGGQSVSYLENTLDYGVCSADNVGCKPYCTDYDFTNDNWNCTLATVGDKFYANKDIEECNQDEEGCHEFIRTKAGLGANMLKNSSFDDFTGTIDDGGNDDFENWGIIGEAVSNGYSGLAALQLSGNLNAVIDVAPVGYTVAGEIFSLSFYAKNCATGDDFGIEADTAPLNQGGQWQYYQTTHIYPETAGGNQVNFNINTASCIVDAIKLERGVAATAYGDYRENGLIYQKLAPDYLGCSGPTPPSECNNFVKKCDQSEVGCELYTSAADNMSIPAKATARDYCPAECAGYDIYIQAEAIFDSLRPAYFIPDTARTCSAESVGCDEFTNLDEVAQGGEGIEYYSYLRQCIKPSDPLADCAEFYTWEGSEETGFQLRVHNLQQDLGEPVVTEDDSLECNAAIYSLLPTDPAYNADCREFYSGTGDIYYHLYRRTISCDNNCHPYRRTENNIDPGLLSAADCTPAGSGYPNTVAGQFSWDGVNNVCYFCKSRGEWSSEHQACIYMAIPGQGDSCSAGQNNCREYSGNAGNNMKTVLNNSFEGSLGGWIGINGAAAELSSTALMAGGESLHVYNANFTASTTVGSLAQKNKSYVLSFLAISAGANQFDSIKLVNGVGDEADFIAAPLALSGNWQLYKVNLAALNHDVSDSESLVIEANGDFYIDNVRLTEIIDRYYLIKNSWATPDACYEDIAGNYMGPTYNLGCDEYRDRDNNAHYLHSFSWLCSDLAVGCEIMIDTRNYSDYNSQIFNAGDPSEITVFADSFIYAVYDKDKKCNSRDKGCERLGLPHKYESSVLYNDVYLKNDPDKYNKILCLGDEAGCEEWATSEGTAYFKDPGDQICEWRQAVGTAVGSWAWQKKKVKRCDDDGNGAIGAGETDVCLDDNDCNSGVSCILDSNDYACPISSYKTLGAGGGGSAVQQPIFNADGYWIGLCPAAQAGCGEYIDPTSRFSVNFIFNADFSQDVDNDGTADGWSASLNGEQYVFLEANTLYILAIESNNMAILDTVAATNDFYELNSNNNLVGPANQISVSSFAGSRAGQLFYTRTGVSAKITISNAASGNGSKVELKQAVVDYQMKQDMDKQACNGIVDFEQGCVLFNERSQNGISLAGLDWDADLTVDDGYGVVPDAGVAADRDSNTLIKASPDRVCGKWLACRSYIKDENDNNVCFDIGLCNSVDDSGNCDSFIVVTDSDKINQTYPVNIDANKISNMSGYVKAGYDNNSLNSDFYLLAVMEQAGQTAYVPNGNFEFAGSNNYPIGWNWEGGIWNENVFTVINNPYKAQEEGIGYAPEGDNFLKLGSAYSAASEVIVVEPSIENVLTAYINTINLSDGEAAVKVEQFDLSGGLIATNNNVATLDAGNNWTFKLGRFTTVGNAARIKVTLHVNPGPGTTGNYYFDNVKIKPALDSKWDTALLQEWYTPQTCRLYPEEDSLSCDYYDDSGIREKGWLGYCLEYDHYPGSKDACLLWWPVDKVKGEGIEEGAGYLDRFPLYYCTGFTVEDIYEYRHAFYKGENCDGGDCPGGDICPPGYFPPTILGKNSDCGTCDVIHDIERCYCIPNGVGLIIPDGSPDGNITCGGDGDNIRYSTDGWYIYNGLATFLRAVNINSNNPYAAYLCDGAGVPCTLDQELTKYQYDSELSKTPISSRNYCSRLVQAVTPIGQNKYWSGRVYEGSSYTVPALGYTYLSDYLPFGSIVYPYPPMNPYEWDSKENIEENQPLFFESPDLNLSEPYQPRAGQPHTNDTVKRLFAQSYGTWGWVDNVGYEVDPGTYEIIEGLDWGPPTIVCDGATRETSSDDYCAYPPVINNIKANNNAGDISITSNGFVNLTFNTDVDSQQLPLVAYAVNWGDNEWTAITGVEMRDRANPDNPHSLYHLYSYWDLKAKQVFDQDNPVTADNENTVYCGGVGADALNYDGLDSGFDCPADSACCVIQPSVKIKDNWDWCNNGISGDPCPDGGYELFGGWIVVREK